MHAGLANNQAKLSSGQLFTFLLDDIKPSWTINWIAELNF